MDHIVKTKIIISNPILSKIVEKYLYKIYKNSKHIFKLKCNSGNIIYEYSNKDYNKFFFFSLRRFIEDEMDYDLEDYDDLDKNNNPFNNIYDYIYTSFIYYFENHNANEICNRIIEQFIVELEENKKIINESYNFIEETSISNSEDFVPSIDSHMYCDFEKRCEICNSMLVKYSIGEKHKLICINRECCHSYNSFNKNIKISEYNFLNKYEGMKNIFCKINYKYGSLPITNEEFPNEILKNLNSSLKDYKDIIKELILITPLTYRYFDHSIIDINMINYLINNFYPNDNYKNFCSDKRFYLYLKKINKFNEELDIVETISKYIELRRVSNYYLVLCPFHDDHNPSLKIFPSKGIWKCFACGEHGSIHEFLNRYNSTNIDYCSKSYLMYKNNIKNTFLYYLFANLPSKLKYDKEIIKLFLVEDGCILKLIPKELKYDKELVEIAMNNDITSFRYILNNKELVKLYLEKYPILEYYVQKRNHTKTKKKKKKIYKYKYKRDNNIINSQIINNKTTDINKIFECFDYKDLLDDDNLPF